MKTQKTAPSSGISTSVDNPKEGSPEKREPDVASPACEEVSQRKNYNIADFKLVENS